MLCQFQVYSKVIQLYICMYLFLCRFHSHLGYYRILSRVPCATQQVYFKHSSVYMSIPNYYFSLYFYIFQIFSDDTVASIKKRKKSNGWMIPSQHRKLHLNIYLSSDSNIDTGHVTQRNNLNTRLPFLQKESETVKLDCSSDLFQL